jgi:hypothetical protein
MPLTDATLNLLGTELDGIIDQMSLHNGDPGATGANEISGGGYARQVPNLAVDGDGDLTLAATAEFSGPASEPVTHIGFWGGGTWRGGFARSAGDAEFSTSGEYNVTAGTITGSSTG